MEEKMWHEAEKQGMLLNNKDGIYGQVVPDLPYFEQ